MNITTMSPVPEVVLLCCASVQVGNRWTLTGWYSGPQRTTDDGGGEDGLTGAAQNCPVLLAFCWTFNSACCGLTRTQEGLTPAFGQ